MTLLAWVMVIVGFVAGVVVGVSFTVALAVCAWRWAKRVVQEKACQSQKEKEQVESGDPLWVAPSRGYN